MQRPTEINIALRKGNLNTQFFERGINLAIDIADNLHPPVHIVDYRAQLKIE